MGKSEFNKLAEQYIVTRKSTGSWSYGSRSY